MNPKLKVLFDALESEREKLFSKLTSMEKDSLTRRRHPDKWSVHEIVVHLVVSEKLSLGYMRKKSLGIETFEDSGLLEAIKIQLLKVSQRMPFKFKAPKSVVENTPREMSLNDVMNQWIEQRKELSDFLNSIEDKHLKKKIYKHPRAGMLNVVQAVTFFREHYIHHWPQIKRLLVN